MTRKRCSKCNKNRLITSFYKNMSSIDHFRALSRGHPLTLQNAIVLCRRCNSSKGSKDPEEFFSVTKLDEIMVKLGSLVRKAA